MLDSEINKTMALLSGLKDSLKVSEWPDFFLFAKGEWSISGRIFPHNH